MTFLTGGSLSVVSMAGILGVGEPLVANYPINLVHVARLSKEERARLKSDFRLVAESIAEKDEREFLHFLRGNNQSIRHGEELMEVITELTGNPGYREQYEKVKKKAQEEKEGEVKMIDFGAIFEERGLQQGRREGKQEGIQITKLIFSNQVRQAPKEETVSSLICTFSITREEAEEYYRQVNNEE